jgi:hypothetical protein
MRARDDLDGLRRHTLPIEIEPIPLPVRCPTFLKSVYRLGGGDAESNQRQDHGANTDVRVRAFANMPATRAPEDRWADTAFGPNSLKHRVQRIAQADDCVEGNALVPLGAQALDHFRKPHSLRVTGSHV